MRILLVSFGLIVFAQAQNWVKLPMSPAGENLYFTTPDIGYAVGGQTVTRELIVFKTTDGGRNWISSQVTNCIHNLHFVSLNVGYSVGSGGCGNDSNQIFKTYDGGNSWTGQYKAGIYGVRSVYFPNADTGYVVGGNGLILKTTDGGVNWIPQISGVSAMLESVHCTGVNTCFAVGGYYVLKTTDGGATWISTPLGGNLNSVFFPTADTGYVAGDAYIIPMGWNVQHIFKTTDGGNSWNLSHNGPPGGLGTLTSIHCTNANTCFAVGASDGIADSANLISTYDGGNAWIRQKLGRGEALRSIHFPTSTVGYIVDDSGVWKTEPLIPVLPAKSFVGRFDLSDSHLRYNLPNPANVQILLFDFGGRQTLRLFDGPQSAGDHALALPNTVRPQFLDFRAGEKRRVIKLLSR